jgi:hypothetical protein
LKDMPILWLPGKSPVVIQTTSFEVTGSQEALRPGVDTESPNGQRSVRTGSRWFDFRSR